MSSTSFNNQPKKGYLRYLTLALLFSAAVANDVCGDGIRGPSEQCDDGNTKSGDG